MTKISGKSTHSGTRGGNLAGNPHYTKSGKSAGGIKAVVTDAGNQPVELEGGEVIINKEASKRHWKELSRINQSAGNGVAIGPPSDPHDEDPADYKTGGKVIDFNPNKIPNKWILKYAETIKEKHPEVWNLGGNVFGNEAFNNLKRVAKRGYWLDSEEWMMIKWRSYVATHKKDYRIEGVVAMLKWVDKVDKGWPYMKNLIESEIQKSKNKKKLGGKASLMFPQKGKTYMFSKTYGDVIVIEATDGYHQVDMTFDSLTEAKKFAKKYKFPLRKKLGYNMSNGGVFGNNDKIYGVVENSEFYFQGDYVGCIELNGYDKDIKGYEPTKSERKIINNLVKRDEKILQSAGIDDYENLIDNGIPYIQIITIDDKPATIELIQSKVNVEKVKHHETGGEIANIVDNEQRVYPNKIRKLFSFVGDGIDELDIDYDANEVIITFNDNASGSISLSEWNKAKKILVNLEKKQVIESYVVNLNKNTIILAFDEEFPVGDYEQGGQTKAQKKKFAKVMSEFEDEELHSGTKTGPIVKNKKQAVAIAHSVSKKYDTGGNVTIFGDEYFVRDTGRWNGNKVLEITISKITDSSVFFWDDTNSKDVRKKKVDFNKLYVPEGKMLPSKSQKRNVGRTSKVTAGQSFSRYQMKLSTDPAVQNDEYFVGDFVKLRQDVIGNEKGKEGTRKYGKNLSFNDDKNQFEIIDKQGFTTPPRHSYTIKNVVTDFTLRDFSANELTAFDGSTPVAEVTTPEPKKKETRKPLPKLKREKFNKNLDYLKLFKLYVGEDAKEQTAQEVAVQTNLTYLETTNTYIARISKQPKATATSKAVAKPVTKQAIKSATDKVEKYLAKEGWIKDREEVAENNIPIRFMKDGVDTSDIFNELLIRGWNNKLPKGKSKPKKAVKKTTAKKSPAKKSPPKKKASVSKKFDLEQLKKDVKERGLNVTDWEFENTEEGERVYIFGRTKDRGQRLDHAGEEGEDWATDEEIDEFRRPYELKWDPELESLRDSLVKKGYKKKDISYNVDYGEKGHIGLNVVVSYKK